MILSKMSDKSLKKRRKELLDDLDGFYSALDYLPIGSVLGRFSIAASIKVNQQKISMTENELNRRGVIYD